MKQKHQDAELINFFSTGDYSSLADEVLALGSKMVSLKSGHRGFYLKTALADRFSDMGAARPAEPENWSARELWASASQDTPANWPICLRNLCLDARSLRRLVIGFTIATSWRR